MEPALDPQVPMPKLAISSTSSHGSQHVGINLDDFPHSLRGYVAAHAGPGVGGDDDALVEDEGERGGPLLVVHHLLGRLLEPIEVVADGELEGELVGGVGGEEPAEVVAAGGGRAEVVLEGGEVGNHRVVGVRVWGTEAMK